MNISIVFCAPLFKSAIFAKLRLCRFQTQKHRPARSGVFALRSSERRGVCLMIGESVGTGIRQREIHLCGFGRSKVAVGTGILHLIEGVAEHLIMRLLAIEEENNRQSMNTENPFVVRDALQKCIQQRCFS